MARRRKAKAPPKKPFEEATPYIDQLERAVISKTIDARFGPEDVADWLYPPEVVATLRLAYKLMPQWIRTRDFEETVVLGYHHPALKVCLKFNATKLEMAGPDGGQHVRLNQEHTAHVEIMATMEAAHKIHRDFEKVRHVVWWLNLYATPGAARHYCPWMTSILPADHSFHKANGQSFREPLAPIVHIAPTMRECGAIMASALLCGELGSVPEKPAVSVQFFGRHPETAEEYWSNVFGLI